MTVFGCEEKFVALAASIRVAVFSEGCPLGTYEKVNLKCSFKQTKSRSFNFILIFFTLKFDRFKILKCTKIDILPFPSQIIKHREKTLI